ncbi:MAG: DUF3667 domain-containing protein [bacterium]|nr:DUF3667 domain-containing protein [bacterium]
MEYFKSTSCLNCGHEVGDHNYCPNCGQVNTDKKQPVRQFFHDFFQDYFTFDSKFFRSIIPLIFKPGHLTREYLKGRRVNYIFPLRLYVFTTFVFFFIVAVNAKLDRGYVDRDLPTDRELSYSKEMLNDLIEKQGDHLPEDVKNSFMNSIDSSFAALDTIEVSGPTISFDMGSDSTDNWFLKYMREKTDYITDRGQEGVNMFLKELVNQIPKVLFVLLPVFALVLKLIYIRRKILYIEHLVLSLHFHTFVFLHLIITVIFTHWVVITLIILGILLYLFLSMKNIYGQSFIKTFLKFGVLMFSYALLMIPAFLLLTFLAVVSL